jgi:hypothetical protein
MLVRQEPSELMDQFEYFEYLAHTLAYNAEKPEVQHPFKLPHQQGSLYKLVMPHVNLRQGIKLYFVLPLDENDNDIKILFRGTKDHASVMRDVEDVAPGSSTFQLAVHQIFTAFNKVLSDQGKSHSTLSVTICGHSLGGADAQMFLGQLLKRMKDWHENHDAAGHEATPYRKIRRVRLATFNSAGILKVYADEFAKDATRLKTIFPALDLQGYCLHSAGDMVQQTGDGHLLAKIPHLIMKVYLIKAYHNKQDENYWQQHLTFRDLDKAFLYFKLAHTTHFFGAEQREQHRFEFFDNLYASGIIDAKLSRKHALLQSYFFGNFRKLLYWALMAHSWMNPELPNASQLEATDYEDSEIWIDVARETQLFLLYGESRKWVLSEVAVDYIKEQALQMMRYSELGKKASNPPPNRGAVILTGYSQKQMERFTKQYVIYLQASKQAGTAEKYFADNLFVKKTPKTKLQIVDITQSVVPPAEPVPALAPAHRKIFLTPKVNPFALPIPSLTSSPATVIVTPKIKPKTGARTCYPALQEINAYIYSRTNLAQDKLSATSKLFRNASLTQSKLELARRARSILFEERADITKVGLLKGIITENAELEMTRKFKLGGSQLHDCLIRIEALLKAYVEPSPVQHQKKTFMNP